MTHHDDLPDSERLYTAGEVALIKIHEILLTTEAVLDDLKVALTVSATLKQFYDMYEVSIDHMRQQYAVAEAACVLLGVRTPDDEDTT